MLVSHLKLKASSLLRLRPTITGNKIGQAAIEMALSLPFIIWLIYYTVNGFFTIHTSHVAQKYAAMNLYQRLNFRSKYKIDDIANAIAARDFVAVRYLDEEGKIPKRKIIVGPSNINTIVGICLEPGCN